MAESFKFELVSPERLLVSEEVESVVIPGTEGEMTVMANHAPTMTTIKPGVVTVEFADGKTDRFVVFGTQHLDHLVAEYLAHYHGERPHQSLENELLVKPKKRGRPSTKRGKIEDEIVPLADVRCSKRLGGLLNSYGRRAA